MEITIKEIAESIANILKEKYNNCRVAVDHAYFYNQDGTSDVAQRIKFTYDNIRVIHFLLYLDGKWNHIYITNGRSSLKETYSEHCINSPEMLKEIFDICEAPSFWHGQL